MKIENYDAKSGTEKWVISRMASCAPGWEGPDFSLVIGGVEVDINEMIEYLAEGIDVTIAHQAEQGAVKKLMAVFGDFQDDLYEIRVEARNRLCRLLDINPDFG